jgi:hypothetical protein
MVSRRWLLRTALTLFRYRPTNGNMVTVVQDSNTQHSTEKHGDSQCVMSTTARTMSLAVFTIAYRNGCAANALKASSSSASFSLEVGLLRHE